MEHPLAVWLPRLYDGIVRQKRDPVHDEEPPQKKLFFQVYKTNPS